jgi:D-sedoheptulose 7-phosphate isomerase
LTAISNDYGFEKVFARQLEALGKKGDTLILLTTSGDSPNIIEAIKMADALGVNTIAFLGKSGGKALNLVSNSIIVDSFDTARIQEMHLLLGHTICEYIDIKKGLGSK